MFRALLRFAGLVCLAAGFACAVVDGTRSIAGNNLSFTRFGDTLAWVAHKRYELAEPPLEKPRPPTWTAAVAWANDIPTWAAFGLLGVALIYIGRPRAPGIGFTSRH